MLITRYTFSVFMDLHGNYEIHTSDLEQLHVNTLNIKEISCMTILSQCFIYPYSFLKKLVISLPIY